MISESVTIILPLPGGILSPNCTIGSMGGRFAKAGAIKKYRRLAEEAVRVENIESAPWVSMSVMATFFFKDKRRRDPDNALGSLKAAHDGIVDSGLIKDDDWDRMKRKEPVLALDRIHPRVELTITRLR